MRDIVEEKAVYTHKESIPFISSVYGLDKNSNVEFENTATYEKISREKTVNLCQSYVKLTKNK